MADPAARHRSDGELPSAGQIVHAIIGGEIDGAV
jgi:hypothetical protein